MHCTLAGAALTAALIAGGQVPAPRATPPLAISTVAIREGPIIVIEATGPLPLPRIGTLRAPDRLYLDFDGVSTRFLRVRGADQVVTGVRAALNSLAPKITRVVIDLSEPCRYSLETSQRGSGHLEIALTPLASPVAPPASALRATAGKPASRLAPRDAATRRYIAAVQPAVGGLDVLRGVLRDIDARAMVTPDRVQAAQSQLAAFRRTLEGATPPRSLEATHDLLKSVIGFASTALSLSANGTGEVTPNASSAAAGALLMLERAEAELGASGASLRKSL